MCVCDCECVCACACVCVCVCLCVCVSQGASQNVSQCIHVGGKRFSGQGSKYKQQQGLKVQRHCIMTFGECLPIVASISFPLKPPNFSGSPVSDMRV